MCSIKNFKILAGNLNLFCVTNSQECCFWPKKTQPTDLTNLLIEPKTSSFYWNFPSILIILVLGFVTDITFNFLFTVEEPCWFGFG